MSKDTTISTKWYIFNLIVLGALLFFVRGWVAHSLWGWFVQPLHSSIPTFTVVHMSVLLWVAAAFRGLMTFAIPTDTLNLQRIAKKLDVSIEDAETRFTTLGTYVMYIVFTLITWCIGACIHWVYQ